MVSELYYPEETSTGHFLTHIAEGLARTLDVGVLCSQPTYAARGERASRQEIRRGVRIYRSRGTTLDKDVLWQRLINVATISVAMFLSAIRRFQRGDVVLVVTNPPTLPFFIALACALRRAKLVLLIHDVYPEVLIAAGVFRERSGVAWAISALTRRLYRASDRIIVLGRDMARLVERKMGAGRETRLAIIPNWADLDEVQPIARDENSVVQRLGLNGELLVQYAGNMGRTHDIETLVEAARLTTDANVHWLFVGAGGKRQYLESAVRMTGLSAVHLLDRCPRNELNAMLNAGDVAIVAFNPGMAGVSVPSRMYNIMAAAKPLIALADADSEVALVVQEESIGWTIPPGSVSGLINVIESIRANRSVCSEYGRRARAVAVEKYSFERSLSAYREVVTSLHASP